jgi:hypothetical protein
MREKTSKQATYLTRPKSRENGSGQYLCKIMSIGAASECVVKCCVLDLF